MGNGQSIPLDEATKEEVIAKVKSLGEKYEQYTAAIDENGVDGDLLAGMNEDDFDETLDDLGITSRLHRRKLLQEFRKACDMLDGGSTVSSYTNDDSSSRYHSGSVLLPARGPIDEVFITEIECRPQDFPLPDELESTGAQRDTHALPAYNQGVAGEGEMQHLSNDFFGVVDSIPGAYRPPVPDDDLERVAQVQAYGLEEIEPDSEAAKTLTGYVAMATKLFAFDFGDITFFDHESQFSFARVGLTDEIREAIIGPIYRPVNQMSDNTPFLCKTGRSLALCNYAHVSKRTFVIHDLHADETFKWANGIWPFRCYAGTPLLSPSGLVLGTLCLHNIGPRLDFDRAHEIQLEQVARMVVQAIENWSLRRRIDQLETEQTMVHNNANKMEPPTGMGVFVNLHIDGYDALQSASSSDEGLLKDALDMYQAICSKLRIENYGFEIGNDDDNDAAGDGSCLMCFHDAVDAFAFSLNLQQQLYDAAWSEGLLAIPEAADDGNASRGLRVCAGVHMGNIDADDNISSGPAAAMARAVAAMGHGGQILCTFDTWNAASFLAETKLESPQVVDLGNHVVQKGKAASDGVISKRILQLVPAPLAVKYIAETGDQAPDDNTASKKGRQFPDLKSLKKLSKSFFDAPSGKEVTIGFIGTGEIEKRYKESSTIIAEVIGHASSLLPASEGYQCQNNMFAFPSVTEAVRFGLSFVELMRAQRPLEDKAEVARLVTFGCVHGTFVALEPHKTTGRADYFGKVVNRAARVAYTSDLGKVTVGVTSGDAPADVKSFQVADPTVLVQFIKRSQLKGVEEEMVIYECKRKRSIGQMVRRWFGTDEAW